MISDLLTEIRQALDDRQQWADDQEYYYRMRNGGIRRKNKPFIGAADLWYPLGDTMVEKLKPAYVNQMYGGENIATFVARKQQAQELTTSVGYYFDYVLKQQSNFERAMFSAIDQMLECGFCPVKVYWDTRTKSLCFDQVDPLHIIVPNTTQEYNENGGVDWLVHILHMSVAEYKANPLFVQDDDVIKRISGRGAKDIGDQQKSDSTDYKEGINCSASDHEIVLWEIYQKDRKKGSITISTISPLLPDDQNSVREDFGFAENKGCFADGLHVPFFRIRSEIKDKSYYAPRGIIKINEPFEASLTHSWNALHDHMSFSARPNFEQTGASVIPSGKNFRTSPGSVLPPGLTMAQHPPPPASLVEDMQMTRAIAVDRTGTPSFSAPGQLTDNVPESQTATGQKLVAAQAGAGTDMRARVFRMDLAEGLKMAWSILLGNAPQDCLEYLQDKELQTVDVSALHDAYDIQPNGSADNWNKEAEVQKRFGFYQTFITNPFADKGELTKWTWEGINPALIKRMFVDPGTQAKDQEEAQAMECLLIKEGFAPQVHEADDDKVHLINLAQFAENKLMRVQMTPDLAGLTLQHGEAHMQALQQKKDPAAAQIIKQLAPMAQVLAHIAQQPGPQANNVVNMMQPQPGANQLGNPQATQTPAAETASSSSQDKPSSMLSAYASLMNSFAAAVKAGIPISSADINALLVKAGLPPGTPPGIAIQTPPSAVAAKPQQQTVAT